MTPDQRRSIEQQNPAYVPIFLQLFGPSNGTVNPSAVLPSLLPDFKKPECKYLGPLKPGKPCGSQLRACNVHHDTTTRFFACKGASRCCVGCNEYVSPLTEIIIEQGAMGVGDGLLGLIAVAKLKADHPGVKIIYRLSDTALPWVRLFDGYDELRPKSDASFETPIPDGRQINVGYEREMRVGITVPRWTRYARNIGASGTLIPHPRHPDILLETGARWRNHIMLCPFSTDASREWGLPNWHELESMLRASGIPTAVVNSTDDRTAEFRGEKITGCRSGVVASALLNSRCVIGSDSGMAHLGGILGKPTIVLELTTNCRNIFGAYPHAHILRRPLPAEVFDMVIRLRLPVEENHLPRVELAASCRDCDHLPRVRDAGMFTPGPRYPVQVMHNGLKVVAGAYCGGWQAEAIRRLRGVHEPQEEKVFAEVLKHCKPFSTMVELGSWWAYYSMWFKKVTGGQAVLVEPDPNNLDIGRRNFDINSMSGEFVHASAGESNDDARPFFCEGDGVTRNIPVICVDGLGLSEIEVLLMDIQGGELAALRGSYESFQNGRVRFVFVSTHAVGVSGSHTTHVDCLTFIWGCGARIIAEHSPDESYSGDGLIVAAMRPEDAGIPVVQISKREQS